MALLRASVEPARAHVFDHPLTQWADGIGTHGKLLSEVDNTSIFRARGPIGDALSTPTRPRSSGLSRSDFVRWHTTGIFAVAAIRRC